MKRSRRKIGTKVRFGVVGLGVMGRRHAATLASPRERDFCLAAVADCAPELAQKAADTFNVPGFTDPQEMFDSGLIDAVLVATPHYLHPAQTISAARAGLHVLCEKPLAAAVGPARAMIAECRKRRVAFGAMLQMRTRAIMKKMRRIAASGRLGTIYHVSMTCSNWYRTQAYYDSGSWRGTWDGEGGGIMLNQAPHSLDLFQWIGGMPTRIMAMLSTRLHKIEVENVAHVICRYEQPKSGSLYLTSAEVPGTDRLALCGDKGTLVFEDGKLRLGRLSRPISRHVFECPEASADDIIPPRCTWRAVKISGPPGGEHVRVIRAFARHVLRGTDMVANGAEAINELEISNAVYLSGFSARAVDLPVDAGAMDRLLARLARQRGSGKALGLRQAAARELKKLLKRQGNSR